MHRRTTLTVVVTTPETDVGDLMLAILSARLLHRVILLRRVQQTNRRRLHDAHRPTRMLLAPVAGVAAKAEARKFGVTPRATGRRGSTSTHQILQSMATTATNAVHDVTTVGVATQVGEPATDLVPGKVTRVTVGATTGPRAWRNRLTLLRSATSSTGRVARDTTKNLAKWIGKLARVVSLQVSST